MSCVSWASIARRSFAGARRDSFLRSTSREAGCGQTSRSGLQRKPYSPRDYLHLYKRADPVCKTGGTCREREDWINLQLPVSSRLLAAMSNESPALIERSIADLERLATFLADELQQPWTTTLLPLSERRLCKEALFTVSVLLPKLRAVRRAHTSPPDRQPPRCTSCDE